MREFTAQAREVLNLTDYTVEVRYTDMRAANRILKRRGYAPLEPGDAAAAIIDTTYLFAMLLFIRPMKRCARAFEIILHELLHVYLRSRIFSRVNHEFLDHYLDASAQGAAYDAMLKIEERAAEHLVRLCQRLGIFQDTTRTTPRRAATRTTARRK